MIRSLMSLSLALALVAGVSACTPAEEPGAGGEQTSAPVVGGSQSLPGDLPSDVRYQEVEDGVATPQLALDLVDGSTVELADYRDRPVVLVFFASWCQWCLDHQADLNALASEYGDSALFLGVTGTDDAEKAISYATEHALPYAVAVDPELIVHRAFAVDEPPLVAVIAPGGNLVRGWPGGVELETLSTTVEGFRADQGE